MMLLNRQLPAFSGVPANAVNQTTVTCKLNLGERVHVLWLELGDASGNGIGTLAAPALIGAIRLKIGSKTQREILGQELNYLNGLMSDVAGKYSAKTSGVLGNAAYRTRLPIFLAEPWRKGVLGSGVPESTLSAWNLVGIETCTIEIDILAGVNAPVIGGFYEYEPATGPIGQIVKWYRQNFGVNANPSEITTLNKLAGAYQSMHLFATSDGKYANSVMFTRNSVQIRQDVTRFQNDSILLTREMTPAALDTSSGAAITNTGIYNMVFDYDDPIQNLLFTSDNQGRPVNELTLKPTFNAVPAGGMIIVSQVSGDPD